VIAQDNQQYRAVYTRVLSRLASRSADCNTAINKNDTIVSKAYVRRAKYFHMACAEKVHIV